MKTGLALCGGGARGILTASLLARPDIQALIGEPALICGTSTGGLIAMMLGVGHPATTIRDAYRMYCPAIFYRPWWRRGIFASKYPPTGIEAVAKEMFGSATMARCLRPTMAVSFSLPYNRPKIYKSWTDSEELLRDVARATSAAPTYFPPTEAGEVDGGVWANNPSMVAYVEMRRLWPSETDFRVICLGTGRTDRRIRASKASGWGLAGWSTHVADLFMDSDAAGVAYQMRALLGTQYIEINPELDGISADLDRCDEAHIARLAHLGDTYQWEA